MRWVKTDLSFLIRLLTIQVWIQTIQRVTKFSTFSFIWLKINKYKKDQFLLFWAKWSILVVILKTSKRGLPHVDIYVGNTPTSFKHHVVILKPSTSLFMLIKCRRHLNNFYSSSKRKLVHVHIHVDIYKMSTSAVLYFNDKVFLPVVSWLESWQEDHNVTLIRRKHVTPNKEWKT